MRCQTAAAADAHANDQTVQKLCVRLTGGNGRGRKIEPHPQSLKINFNFIARTAHGCGQWHGAWGTGHESVYKIKLKARLEYNRG